MTTTIRLTGMRTVHCTRAVRTALMALPGIDAVDVQLGVATLEHATPVDPQAIHAALAVTDYGVTAIATAGRALRILPASGAQSENQ